MRRQTHGVVVSDIFNGKASFYCCFLKNSLSGMPPFQIEVHSVGKVRFSSLKGILGECLIPLPYFVSERRDPGKGRSYMTYVPKVI